MNEILETREVLGTLELPAGECELVASATAEYSEGSANLVVRLDATIHRRSLPSDASPVAAEWLPKNQTVSEFVPIDEAGEVARDIFRRWVRKVRESAPNLHQPSFT
jgi:hypothetical protein